ncbi:tyrosine-type recombinase/integrase [Salinarchaeum chitinilyticum]
MSQNALEPIEPERAIELYLEDRSDELRTATQRAYRSALGIFEEWTEEYGVTNLNDLSGRDLVAFKNWRKKEADISTITLNAALAILKRFFRFCEIIEAVEPDFHERVPLPNVPPDAEVKNDVPEDEAVEAIRSHYQQFEYASRRHTYFELIAEVGVRLGAVIAIDLGDIQWDREAIQLRHRPMVDNGETPLKNGAGGERIVNLSPSFTGLLEDYVQHSRHDVVDDAGREPLFTTAEGRISTTTVRRDFYKLTRPCEYTGECPHDREISDCEATARSEAVSCPSSFTTHPLRKWSIMQQLNDGVPKEILSDRVDVSVPVLDKHYDQRSQERKSLRRREVLESNHREYHMTDGGEVDE